MIVDARGIEIKKEDTIIFNGITMTVKEIKDNRLALGTSFKANKLQAQMTLSELVCQVEIQFDSSKPVNVLVLKPPTEQEKAGQGEGAQA